MAQPTVPKLLELIKNDDLTWSMYSRGLTLGLNQAEKEKSTQKVMQYSPRNISEMTAFCAGIRPGFASMAPKMFGRQRFSYGIPVLDNMLQTKEMPDSFILYQEQVMAILQYGGFEPSESYAAIKAIAKKHPEKVLPMKERFMNGFTERLIKESGVLENAAKENATMVWKIIEDNTSYSFNCVSGDTIIINDKFEGMTVEEMYNANITNIKALSMHEDNHVYWNDILDIVNSGEQEVYTITTCSGKKIKATYEHKFPVGSYDRMVRVKDLHIGDMLFVNNEGYEVAEEKIVSIEAFGFEHVYDVVMNDKYHNFVVSTGIVTGNCSHACCVALDSLYTAWAKAHYPYETYAELLKIYADNGDKKRIDMAKNEMKRGFGITMTKPKFRQDNTTYYIDKEKHTISDVIYSIKGIGKKDAAALYALKDKHYSDFVDLLYEMENTPKACNSGVVETLIKFDYFEEFGKPGKLLSIFKAFKEGSNRYDKALCAKTNEKHLLNLHIMEMFALNEDLPIELIVTLEAEKLGTPTSTDEQARGKFCVLDIDDKYSPKITLYSLRSGKVTVFKMRKNVYMSTDIKKNDIIEVHKLDTEQKQAYMFVDGKTVPKEGVKDWWIKKCTLVYRK